MSDTIKKIAALAAEAGVTDAQLVAALRAAFGTKAPKESPVFTGTGSIPNLKVTQNLNGATGTFTGILKAANPAADTDVVTLAYLKALQWLTDGAIAGTKLANNAVTAAKIAANAVDSSKIKDGSIAFADLAAAAIATQAQAIAGTAANLLLTPQGAKAMIDNALSGLPDSGVPAGTLIHFAGKSVPDGYLIANGARVSVADYPALYAAIGNTFGGNSTTFYLPNLSGRFLEGTTSTSSVGSYYSAGLPNIRGTFENSGNSWEAKSTGCFSHVYDRRQSNSGEADDGSTVTMAAASSSSIYGSSSGVQPPSMATLILIKT